MKMLIPINLLGIVLPLLIFLNNANGYSFGDLLCSFTGGTFCKWNPTITPSLWKFLEKNDRNIQYNGPLNAVNSGAKFIQIYSNKSSSVVDADLKSPLISSTTGTNCFSFYYHIHGEHAGSIVLNLMPTVHSSTQSIWQQTGPAGDMWHYKEINIGPQSSSFYLRFEINSGHGAIALELLGAATGACAPQGSLCDFESGNCNWTSSYQNNPSYNFKLLRASSSGSAASDYDHSTETGSGHFMEVSGGNSGDTASLTSPTFRSSGTYCMKFWYWRHNSAVEKIQVLKKYSGSTTQSWQSDYTYPSQTWHQARVTLYVYSNTNIIIKAIKSGSSASSAIDIDDISFESGVCPAPVDCDFNKDLCGWTRFRPTVYWIWDNGFGRVDQANKVNIKYPPTDRSSSQYGMYLYTDYTEKVDSTNQSMTLNSEFVPATIASCLNFYYIPVDFDDPKAAFRINLIDSTGRVIKNVFKYNYAKDPASHLSPAARMWQKQPVYIVSSVPFRISLVVDSSMPSTYLAVDDITYKSGSCGSTTITTTTSRAPTHSPTRISSTTVAPNSCQNKFLCQKSKLCIDRKLVCNFHSDCGSGDDSDELNCGTCSFNGIGMCGWTNAGEGSQQWLVKSAGSFAKKVFPSADSTGNKTGGFLIIDMSAAGNKLPANLVSPVLGATGSKCVMRFSYRHVLPLQSKASLFVAILRIDGKKEIEKLLLTIEENSEWKAFEVPIGGLSAGYRVKISGDAEVDRDIIPYIDLELDEIKFINCGQTNPH